MIRLTVNSDKVELDVSTDFFRILPYYVTTLDFNSKFGPET